MLLVLMDIYIYIPVYPFNNRLPVCSYTNVTRTATRPPSLKDVVFPAFRHAVETSRFREHPEGEAGDRDSGMGMKVVSKQTIGVPRYVEKNKNEAPL